MQNLSQIYVLFLIFQTSCFFFSSAIECQTSKNQKVAYTITVSQSGDANFTTITDAFNSIPPTNNQWIKIFVNQGIYNERIRIVNKECIFLEGSSSSTTKITSDAHNWTLDSVTVIVYADNFIAKSISFKNSYRQPLEDAKTNPMPAVAFGSFGDKHAFYACGFEGYQDTLWDSQGRHFFRSCYIEGAIDFIWGGGKSVYQQCTINVTGDGFITAQGRQSAQDTSGYVFKRCIIKGTGHVDLGRAYRPFSRVIYMNSIFSNVVNPEGWSIWEQHGHKKDVTYAEVGCTGPGAYQSSRVSWMKKLNASELQKYTTAAFIDNDGWIAKQPV